MSNIALYQPLIELEVAIAKCKGELAYFPNAKKKSELETILLSLEEKVNEKCLALVDKTVVAWDSSQSLSSFLSDELNSLKEVADKSWHLAIEGVRERLIKLADIETKKSPAFRKFEKIAPLISFVAIVIIILSLKWYWLVEVNQPIETTKGVVQRAGTLEKLLDYDDSMDTHVRRGGWLKGILFWPVEPTEKEVKHASEFLWTTVEVYDYLLKERTICGAQMAHDSKGNNMKDEIAVSQVVIDYLKATNPNNADSGALLIANAFISKFPCK